MLTPEDVGRLASLARIDLSDDERTRLAPQLEVILQSVAKVSEVATDDVPPTSHALSLTNVFRDDQVQPSLPVTEVMAMAPAWDEDRFKVPRILQEDS